MFDGSTVRRFDGSTVRRFDGSTVRRFDGSESPPLRLLPTAFWNSQTISPSAMTANSNALKKRERAPWAGPQCAPVFSGQHTVAGDNLSSAATGPLGSMVTGTCSWVRGEDPPRLHVRATGPGLTPTHPSPLLVEPRFRALGEDVPRRHPALSRVQFAQPQHTTTGPRKLRPSDRASGLIEARCCRRCAYSNPAGRRAPNTSRAGQRGPLLTR